MDPEKIKLRSLSVIILLILLPVNAVSQNTLRFSGQFSSWINAGIDYTFSVGNGIYVAYEHLLSTLDDKACRFSNNMTFSMLSANYPVGLFDKLGAILYYNWTKTDYYSFVSWQRQFDNIILYLIAYMNPEQYQLPAQTRSSNMFAGKGIQIMFVFNH